jgi:hypothetical protein
MLRFVFLLLTAALELGHARSSSQWEKTVSKLSWEYPSLRSLFTTQLATERGQPLLKQVDLKRTNYLLRFLHLPESSSLRAILDGATFPDNINGVSYESINHLLRQDEEQSVQMLRDYISRVYERQGMTMLTRADREYQECAKDFESFIGPITNPLIELLFDSCEETEWVEPCYNGTLPRLRMYPDGRKSKWVHSILIT